MTVSRCGCMCSTCEFVEQCGCKGCLKSNGHPFHGECPVAMCCIEKGHGHCGECESFPCKQLNDYAFDPEHGDNGERLETLRCWLKES